MLFLFIVIIRRQANRLFTNCENRKHERVRTGVIGNKRTGVMGYSSEHYVLENCEPYGRDYSICDVGAERAIYRE